jgi:acetoacetyl-CoA reductase
VHADQVVLVSGGMGVIGSEICRHFLSQSFTVVATANRKSFNQTDIDQWYLNFSDLEKARLHIFPVDVTDFSDCQKLINKILSEVGAIQVLVNNAGIIRDGMFKKSQYEDWFDVINVNLIGALNMSRAVINHMIDSNYGRIINISSVNGQKGQLGQVNYSASKAGLYGFTKALAQEVIRHNITVNAVSPGYVESGMTEKMKEEVRQKILDTIPAGRFAKPSEIARAVNFLADPESAYITGINFPINGGQYLS